MTKHLPECVSRNEDYGIEFVCVCRELRACEQRVKRDEETWWTNYVRIQQSDSYNAGLDAARDAVARLLPSPGDAPRIDLRDALAAIDALRAGDHSAPRQPEGYSPTATDNRP